MRVDHKKTGKLIADSRKEKQLTQRELASMLHVSDSTVSKWERGAGFPDVSMIESLTQALGISIAELFCGEREEAKLSATTESLLGEVLRIARAEIVRKKKHYLFLSALFGCCALLWAILLIFYERPMPTLGGSYQSEMIGGYIVQFAVQPQDNTFVQYIDCREVNKGSASDNGDGTYVFDGDVKDFTVTLKENNSFDLILVKLVENRVITLENISKVPIYIGMTYGDEEAYKDYLR